MLKNNKKILWIVLCFAVMLMQGSLLAQSMGDVERVKSITTMVINESTQYRIGLITRTLHNPDELYYPVGKIWVDLGETVSKDNGVNVPYGRAKLLYMNKGVPAVDFESLNKVGAESGEYEFELPNPVRFQDYAEFEKGALSVQIKAKAVLLEQETEEGALMTYGADYTVIIRDAKEKNNILSSEDGFVMPEEMYL